MDAKKFREIEELYKDLKERQAAGEVSAEDMKAELKKMMIRGEDSRFWMLGGKTGGWYVYDGSSWTAADPYAGEATETMPAAAFDAPAAAVPAMERPRPAAKPVARESEEKPETFCKFCHSRMDEHDAYCRFCGGSPKAAEKPQTRRPTGDEIQLMGVRLFSLVKFFGGLGLILGVVFGATFGIFPILGDLIFQFPMMLQEMRGKFTGGLFFGAIGGIAGFFALALLAVLLGLFFNALCFVFKGPRFKVRS